MRVVLSAGVAAASASALAFTACIGAGTAPSGSLDTQPPPRVHDALTVSVTGPGAVRSPSLPPDCKGSCRLELPAGAPVHLEAAADGNGEFEAWSGACAGTGAYCRIVLDCAALTNASASAGRRKRSFTSSLAAFSAAFTNPA